MREASGETVKTQVGNAEPPERGALPAATLRVDLAAAHPSSLAWLAKCGLAAWFV